MRPQSLHDLRIKCARLYWRGKAGEDTADEYLALHAELTARRNGRGGDQQKQRGNG